MAKLKKCGHPTDFIQTEEPNGNLYRGGYCKRCFADMTHIEVPRERAVETRAKLQAHTINVPVFALEDGEDYCRRFSFWQLVNGKPLALPA